MNIPIYRAKKIDTDEYIDGMLIEYIGMYYILKYEDLYNVFNNSLNYDNREIDSSTLSIHFPDMIANDSDRFLPNGERDLRIFASLSDDGKGGDILDFNEIEWGGKFLPEVCILYKVIGNFKMCGSFTDIKEWRTIIGIKK